MRKKKEQKRKENFEVIMEVEEGRRPSSSGEVFVPENTDRTWVSVGTDTEGVDESCRSSARKGHRFEEL